MTLFVNVVKATITAFILLALGAPIYTQKSIGFHRRGLDGIHVCGISAMPINVFFILAPLRVRCSLRPVHFHLIDTPSSNRRKAQCANIPVAINDARYLTTVTLVPLTDIHGASNQQNKSPVSN